MSTRCNVKITAGENVVWIYRHMDGYLSGAGYDVAVNLSHAKDWKSFMDSLLAQRYEATEVRKSEPIYELTTGQHGDIEFLYEIEFKSFSEVGNWNEVQFKVKEKKWNDEKPFQQSTRVGYRWKLVHNQHLEDFNNIKEISKKLNKIFDEKKAQQDKETKIWQSYYNQHKKMKGADGTTN
jgi:hypothetical protein